jgi:hypothetical protein
MKLESADAQNDMKLESADAQKYKYGSLLKHVDSAAAKYGVTY